MDIITPVTDYLSNTFFTDNELKAQNPANVNVGAGAWDTIVELDLGTIYVGERFLITVTLRAVKTTNGAVYVELRQATNRLRAGTLGAYLTGQSFYMLDAGPLYGSMAIIAECYSEGTETLDVQGICSAGTCLFTTPQNVVTCVALRKL